MEKPLITVITAVLNDAAGLQETFESVLAQNFAQMEYVVMDGKSTDNTVAVINRYRQEFIKRGIKLKWISEKDSGIYEAFNKGIDMASGQYLIFMGAGDYFIPNILTKIQGHLATGRYDILYGNAYDQSRQIMIGEKKDGYKLIRENICHQVMFYRAGVFEKLGYYSLRYPILSDYHFNMRCFSPQNRLKICYTKQLISVYKGGGVSEREKDKVFWDEFPDMIRENLGEEALRYYEMKCEENRIRMCREFIEEKISEKAIRSSDHFVIYGTAEWGQRFYDVLQNRELHVIAFSDSDPNKWNKEFNGYKIIPPEEIKNTDFTKILIASSKWSEIRDNLIKMGHGENDIIYLYSMKEEK